MAMMKEKEESTRALLEEKSSFSGSEEYLELVLQRLMIPQNKIVRRSIEVFIPEICYFKNGEADTLYFSRELHVNL